MNTKYFRLFCNGSAVAMVLLIAIVFIPLVDAQEGLPPLAAYTQNFNTLASTPEGGTTNTGIPNGWTFSESSTNADTNYRIEDGTVTNGDTYSFGTASASDRALGGLNSGTLIPTIGVWFQNNTGGTVGQIQISYYCEMWRQGATGRVDRMDFQYSTDATSLTDGTWTDIDTLDCVGADTGVVGVKDGNTQRTLVNGSITGLSMANGSTFWLRWITFDAIGSDDGLAIDDFVMNEFTTNAVTVSNINVYSSMVGYVGVFALSSGFLILRKRR